MKSEIFQIKDVGKTPTHEPTPNILILDTLKPRKAPTKKSKHKVSPLPLHENLVDKIVNNGTYINVKHSRITLCIITRCF